MYLFIFPLYAGIELTHIVIHYNFITCFQHIIFRLLFLRLFTYLEHGRDLYLNIFGEIFFFW